jgi:hypothetical protein
MSVPMLFTMSDVVDDLLDFARGLGKGASVPMLSRSIRSAYREILAAHDWSFMEAMSRIQLEAVYSTGTITYTSSSRQVTLADGVFPANAQDMRILFDGVTSFVESPSLVRPPSRLSRPVSPDERGRRLGHREVHHPR